MSKRPSKNCVAPCTLTLSAGLTNVTVVPTGTRRCVGAIALTAADSVVPTEPLYVRARTTVLLTTDPSMGPPDTGRRTTGGGGVGAGATVPPIWNAHRKSPRGAESPYGMPVPPAYTARYCTPSTSYMMGLELIAAPVWKRHRSRPVCASRPSRLPSG